MKYFNTTFSGAMLPTGVGLAPVQELSSEKAAAFWSGGDVANVANPTHANTLAAVSQVLGVDATANASGRKVSLQPGDECLVAELENGHKLPRETRQFTDEELALAGPIRFRLFVAQ